MDPLPPSSAQKRHNSQSLPGANTVKRSPPVLDSIPRSPHARKTMSPESSDLNEPASAAAAGAGAGANSAVIAPIPNASGGTAAAPAAAAAAAAAPTAPAAARRYRDAPSGEEEMLATNLQETYKNILKLEVETQQGCSEVNQRLIENDAGAEITSQLWVVYKNVVQLLDHYYDFLLYALSPTSARAGKPLVTNYRILRRMWVYGVVSFLEVLKNVAAIFVEHEICACFIAYAFNILSCLTDPQLGVEGWWSEKLGDLSRMAIALYPGRYMDWKASSVYWYRAAMKTQFGHGKIYYHACTVESDNLEALAQLGVSVACHDPFVPTPQYLRMVVDNVCSQRNILSSTEMAMIDFVKIHKILLLLTYNSSPEMVSLVSHYATHFGLDSSNIDFFQMRGDASLGGEKLQFWFQKSANFALCNINHLMGFGDSRNPFAKLFSLPESLKERKERKDRRKKTSKASDATSDDSDSGMYGVTADELDVDDWYSLLDYVNRGVLELSVRMVRQYISGPLQTSTPHVIVWLYFLVAIGQAVRKHPKSGPLMMQLLQKFFPWAGLVPYLNDILCVVRAHPEMRQKWHDTLEQISSSEVPGTGADWFSDKENIWEAWKCWGSLWFDQISPKRDYTSLFETGVKSDIFDVPAGGPRYYPEQDVDRYIRILVLAQVIAREFPDLGITVSDNIFKYHLPRATEISSEAAARLAYFCEDQRFQGMPEKPPAALITPWQQPTQIDIDVWAGPNTNPKLPSLEANSYGFMTEVINNQYPALTGDKHGDDVAAGAADRTGGAGEGQGHQQRVQQRVQQRQLQGQDADDEAEFMDDPSSAQPGMYQADAVRIPGNLGDKMDTALTFISLDTNTWLKHCGRIFKCVRSDIFRLSVPLTVFQELRSLRRSTDASVADSATRAVIIIRQLYAEKDVLPVRADGSKASSLNETLEFEQNQNWRSNTDEIIMKAIRLNDDLGKSLLLGNNYRINQGGRTLSRYEASVFKYNILITDNRNMSLRSKAIRLTNFSSAWLFEQIEKVSKGRCDD